ncbi:aminoglycoside N(3)-acetyltransferase [Aquibacillus rhizosphaerae]|uniref:Aminoglycoside N(3)-acetyltransferase n=1 Tax=Aquibacillus rhizosphaerae TaxID=3051431 RepID=A0ABT7L5L6_9BACI|nr:AAC(3) family N-acetyltransferase [Aquibacillus sp. LR5S19]MDL4841149.1 AAC(3) family N-acetyltransferase [Aquibacillus sp. LR5S19]
MEKAIKNTSYPRTRYSIKKQLVELGLEKGMTVLVHSSLSSMGWVNGGEVAVIQALQDVITIEGTIVMPSQSVVLSDPEEWEYPPVPQDWWEEIKCTMPAYDARITPTTGMGKIVEVFRMFPGVIRSSHPAYSFIGWGKDSKRIIKNQSLSYSLGENSPLAQLYDQEDAYILMLGTGFDSCTGFHLAEYRIPYKNVIQKGAPVYEGGERVWKTYKDLEFREELFKKIGEDFKEKTQFSKEGNVGSASSTLIPFRQAVDFAQTWLTTYDEMFY